MNSVNYFQIQNKIPISHLSFYNSLLPILCKVQFGNFSQLNFTVCKLKTVSIKFSPKLASISTILLLIFLNPSTKLPPIKVHDERRVAGRFCADQVEAWGQNILIFESLGPMNLIIIFQKKNAIIIWSMPEPTEKTLANLCLPFDFEDIKNAVRKSKTDSESSLDQSIESLALSCSSTDGCAVSNYGSIVQVFTVEKVSPNLVKSEEGKLQFLSQVQKLYKVALKFFLNFKNLNEIN